MIKMVIHNVVITTNDNGEIYTYVNAFKRMEDAAKYLHNEYVGLKSEFGDYDVDSVNVSKDGEMYNFRLERDNHEAVGSIVLCELN